MARRRRGRPRTRSYSEEELPRFQLSPETKRGVLVVVFILLAVISFLALFDAAGSLGEIIVKLLGLLFGQAAIVAPLWFFLTAMALLLSHRKDQDEGQIPSSNLRVYLGALLLAFAVTGILHLFAMRADPNTAFDLVKESKGGGYIGVLVALPLFSLVDFWSSFLILLGLGIVSIVVIFNVNLPALFRRAKDLQFSKTSTAQEVKINKLEPSTFNVSKVVAEEQTGGANESDQGKLKTVPEITLSEGAKDEQVVPYDKIASRYRKDKWLLPSVGILEASNDVVDSGNIEAHVSIIQKTLKDFGIPVEMGEVNVGPTVTQYTLRPAQGIKLSQIMVLQNDLALALSAPSIRIEAPIPGKPLVGIEIPNKTKAIVRVKDVIQTESFAKHASSLAFALGRDVAGHPMVADLAKMPHLLIAGATGTGKSVAINSLLISFLYRNSPEELRFIVIDPKRVELNLYNGIPHLLTPVITDYEKAVNALKWAVREMDRRYNVLATHSKRNILEYNAASRDPLPYIVIIVDELADLMVVAQADVETAVVRLSQMARAVGVHLVLATQRPSVDIITGLIKANITARMAFAVASGVDSRTILDVSGAEKLLGAGDMLYVTAELAKPKRIQGTYISEKEVKNVVNFLKGQSGDVDYNEEILEKQRIGSALSGYDDEGDDDVMLQEAIEAVKQAQKASASLLQRRLRVGYARAARLLDLMEERGMIGPADGAKPRDVYLGQETLNSEDEGNFT